MTGGVRLSSAEPLRGILPIAARRPFLRAVCLTVLAAALGFAVAAPAHASPWMKGGLFDDGQTLSGNSTTVDAAFADYTNLGVQVLRVNLNWNRVAPTKPAIPSDPNDIAYDWTAYDEAVRRAAGAVPKIDLLLDILGSPSWATAGPSPQYAPRSPALRAFAVAAATRYSGTFDPDGDAGPAAVLPRVKYWGAWNEPNLSTFLKPQWRRINGRYVSTAPRLYAQICNQIVAGVHAAQSALTGELVACGFTSPRGNNRPASNSPSHTPLLFLRGMKRAGARFDRYAHHPYSPKQPPTWRPPSARMITLGNIGLLVSELTRLYGKKPIWITEYGWETKPEDPLLGISKTKQASWLKQAYGIARKHPRIDMFIWFLLRDEPDRNGTAFGVPGWQSGFYADGQSTPKPAYAAFRDLLHS